MFEPHGLSARSRRDAHAPVAGRTGRPRIRSPREGRRTPRRRRRRGLPCRRESSRRHRDTRRPRTRPNRPGKLLARPSTIRQATMTMTATAMPLLGIIPPPFCVRHLHGPVTGSDLGLAAGGKETPTVRPPDRQPRPQWAARGTVLTATRSAHIIRQFPDEEAEPSYQKPNWPAGYCRRPLPLPRRARRGALVVGSG
jgi:hypothetical protein